MLIPFNNTYVRLPEAFYARVDPTPVHAPRWIALNRGLAEELGIDPDALESEEGLAILSGNRVPEGAEPIAMAYAGHQFGGFVPSLGDGRANLLGEVVDRNGVRRDIHLKGSGPTPFSRRGDGRSALGPVLREYIVSEAMAALGIPTTRALAAIWSGERVYREKTDPGGVFTRVASSHLRIGTLEYFSARGEIEHLRTLVQYVIDRHYPADKDAADPALSLVERVAERQAALVARWMGVGFIHGVMNTDNMSLSGETIDYGPCAFLDDYDPEKKFSFIDRHGRYAFGNQPNITAWNLARLAEAVFPLVLETHRGDRDLAAKAVDEKLGVFAPLFQEKFRAVFGAKIGVEGGGEPEWMLVESLLAIMEEQGADFTQVFCHLTRLAEDAEDESSFVSLFARSDPAVEWVGRWRRHLAKAGIEASAGAVTMRRVNPVFVPRNHRIEEAIQAGERADFEPFHRLNRVLSRPYEEQEENRAYENPPLPHEVVAATFCGT